jgi:DNA-binding NtrC family response regulator
MKIGILNLMKDKLIKRKERILLVDDDQHILRINNDVLENEGYKITTASCGEHAIEMMEKENFDLVVTDLIMGQVNGLAVLQRAKELNPDRPVIITTGSLDVRYAIEAIRLNVDDYLLKPYGMSEFIERVSHCLKKSVNRQINHLSVA